MGLKNLNQRRERQTQHSASQYRGGFEQKFVSIPVKGQKGIPPKSQITFMMLPPVRGVFPDVPLVYSRCGIEVAREPEVAIPDKKWDEVQRWKEKTGFHADITWVLNSESYDEGDDSAPGIIDVFLDQAKEAGLLGERGFIHKRPAVAQALSKLLAWRTLMIPCLACATKEVVSTRVSGDREYTDYGLKKIKNPRDRKDPVNWIPVLLEIEDGIALYNKLQDELSAFAEANDVDKSTRQQPILFTITKDERNRTTLSDIEFGDRVAKELWATVTDAEGYPNFEKRTESQRLDDEEIAELMIGSWWWPHVAKSHPEVTEMIEEALQEANDDDEDYEDDEDE